MKKLPLAISVLLGWAITAWPAAPPTLKTLLAIHGITNAEASHALPVAFEATVIYYRGYERTLFVQDGDFAIYVQPAAPLQLAPGDRVRIEGSTHESFRPFVVAKEITVLRHGDLPKPVPADFDQLIRAQQDCKLVTVRGVVRSADLIVSSSIRATSLKLQSEGGYIDVVIDSKDATPLKDMLDAEVEVTGASSGRFDGKMQQTGVLIHVTSLAGVKVLNRAQSSPWSLPVTPMGEVLTSFHVKDQTQRVRVQGIITYYQPGSSVVLQDGTRSLWIRTDSIAPLHVGNVADATGFPNVHDGFLTLTSGEIQESQKYAPISPQAQTWKQLVTSKHVFDLVSVEGTVVTEVRGGAQDEYVLTSEGYIFSAVYHHPDVEGVAPLSPLEHIPTGSTVRVTGICVLESSNPFDRDVPFNILLRSSEDLAVIAEPSWLNIRNLMLIVGMLLLAVVAASVWGWTLKRKVRRQTAALSTRIEAEAALERQLAQLEQRRSRILEDINGTEPLAGILERITELTSFRLGGSPCWCEITDGARLGEFPREGTDLRIIHQEIPARSGPALGKLFAGFVAETKPGMHEAEALSVGAKLATLAIETRRLYSDLLHRSEFDLLTDIHNRFSLDKYLDARIEEARQKAAIFGLIYVDLDLFKQVNDLYGHQIGDLYLREVSLRMKRQLRTGDMLARLGGDEFAALVPTVRNRAEVEEIALRLEHCFDDPFLVDGSILQGSASVGIAIYPENGVTKDSLLNAADAAMYVAKNANRYVVGVAAAGPDPDKH